MDNGYPISRSALPAIGLVYLTGQTIGETYPANGCIHCDAMVGEFYLVDLLLDNLGYGEAGPLADRSSTTSSRPGRSCPDRANESDHPGKVS